MTIFQIGAVLFALFMMYVLRVHFKRQLMDRFEYSLWISIWLFFIVIAIFPQLLLGIAQLLRFQRVFDLLTVGAFMVLSFVVFRTYFLAQRMEKRLSKAIQDLAIKEATPEK